jgi:hypothetical protein
MGKFTMTHDRRLAHLNAWLLVGGVALSAVQAQAASVDEATKAQLKAATEYYDRGVEAMDADKFAEAHKQFQLSYDTVNSPNSHMMVGRALVKLGRLPEAYRELTHTIQEATRLGVPQKKYKKTVDAAQKELDEIRGKLAFVTLRQAARVQIQGQSVAPSSWPEPQPVVPGNILVEVRFADGRQLTKQLSLKAGETSEVAVETPPVPTMTASEAGTGPVSIQQAPARDSTTSGISRKTVGYVFGTVGLVGVGAFVGFGIVGASSYGNSKSNCTAVGCPESSVSNEGSKGLMRGIGYAGLGVGILGLTAGTWLILSGDPTSNAATSLRIEPSGLRLEHCF